MLQSRHLSWWALASFALAGSTSAIQFGQFSDFQDATTQGWGDGQGNGDYVATGGPNGTDDGYFAYTPFNKLIFFNRTTWAGNYLSAHVSRVEFDVANFGDTDTMHVRVAAYDDSNFFRNAFSTLAAIDLPPDHTWRHVSFDLSPSAMTLVSGSFDYSTVMSNLVQLRILSAAQPSYQGDFVSGTLAVDNVRALTLPGDADFSNAVDSADFTALASHFNQAGQGWSQGDFNFDGTVNALDFNMLATNFGQMVGAPALGSVVPEPAVMSLLIPAAWSLKRPRQHKSG